MPRRFLSALVALIVSACAFSQSQPTTYSQLKWRCIGPFRGGRSVAVAGSAARPKEYYFGATGGGVWKTTDSGATWKNVSDGFFSTASVGAVAIAPSNPDVVYAGTGERDIRGNISHGDGVYRSGDGGKTWQHVGLVDTQNVSRIIVDPAQPDTVYVAALGHIYGPNPDRGVFKSTDGGQHWQKVLFVSETAGAVDLCIDPATPSTLYAATWEAWRNPYHLNSGGPGSKLFKSTDAGATWTDLSNNPGMPKGVLGKIGITVSRPNPKRLYANIEAEQGGIFKSDDAGATWTLVNDSHDFRQRAWYFSHIFADTKDENTVYDLNVGSAKSVNGGKNFTFFRTPHGDNHDLWIAPDDPKRMIEANDGGASVTTDGGTTWSAEEYPTAQFYHVVADNAFPYHLLGAQQDNSSVRIASRTERGGISRTDWTSTAGGESGYITPKPDEPDLVFGGNYNGEIGVLNHRTNQYHDVNPWPDIPMGWAAKDLKERFQWTFPIVFSPNNANVLYTASQYLYRTTNGGFNWQRISPDLTRNDPKTQVSSGGPLTQDNTSVEYYGTIFTVAESPKRQGWIWTGSDDGLVHLSRDEGGHWQDVTPAGMPHWGKVSMIEPSHFDERQAFVAVDNHTADDFAPYVYRTTDEGRTWQPIVAGIPKTTFARSVREDPKVRGLLYLATETGVLVSFNNGDTWQSLQLNLPLCPVHDLTIKGDDLCAATHGRSFWILDDITPLRQQALVATTQPLLFAPADALRVTWGGFGFGRAAGPSGENPPSGLMVDYVLPKKAKLVKFDVLDAKGNLVMSQDSDSRKTISTEPGPHRVSARIATGSYHTFPGMVFWSGDAAPIPAPPGRYQVRMTVDGFQQTRQFRLLNDPRNSSSQRDLDEQYAFSLKVRDRVSEANDAVVTCRDLLKKIDASKHAAKDSAVDQAADQLAARLNGIESAINQDKIKSDEDALNYPIMLNNKLAALLENVQSGPFRPTAQAYAVYADLSRQLQPRLDALKAVESTDLPALNTLLKQKGAPQVMVGSGKS